MRRTSWHRPRLRSERESHAVRALRERPEELRDVVASVIGVLARGPTPSQTKLRKAVRADLGRVRDGDVDAAVVLLGHAVKRTRGARGANVYSLDVDALPEGLRPHVGKRHDEDA